MKKNFFNKKNLQKGGDSMLVIKKNDTVTLKMLQEAFWEGNKIFLKAENSLKLNPCFLKNVEDIFTIFLKTLMFADINATDITLLDFATFDSAELAAVRYALVITLKRLNFQHELLSMFSNSSPTEELILRYIEDLDRYISNNHLNVEKLDFDNI